MDNRDHETHETHEAWGLTGLTWAEPEANRAGAELYYIAIKLTNQNKIKPNIAYESVNQSMKQWTTKRNSPKKQWMSNE
jgi:hypothetical protein